MTIDSTTLYLKYKNTKIKEIYEIILQWYLISIGYRNVALVYVKSKSKLEQNIQELKTNHSKELINLEQKLQKLNTELEQVKKQDKINSNLQEFDKASSLLKEIEELKKSKSAAQDYEKNWKKCFKFQGAGNELEDTTKKDPYCATLWKERAKWVTTNGEPPKNCNYISNVVAFLKSGGVSIA